MKRLIRLLEKLYPGPWRKRYGAEFSALLEDAPADWTTPFDILKGALTIQMRTSNSIKLIAITAAAGALIALGISFALPRTYQSSAVLAVKAAGDAAGMPSTVRDLATQAESPDSLLAIIRKEKLYARDAARTPEMELVERMRRGISVTPVDGIPWDFRIQFEYGEPGAAQRVTQDLTSGFLRAANTAHNLEVLAISVLPQTPAGLPRAAITTTGLALGLGLGAIVAALLKRRFAQGPAAS